MAGNNFNDGQRAFSYICANSESLHHSFTWYELREILGTRECGVTFAFLTPENHLVQPLATLCFELGTRLAIGSVYKMSWNELAFSAVNPDCLVTELSITKPFIQRLYNQGLLSTLKIVTVISADTSLLDSATTETLKKSHINVKYISPPIYD